ncbi:hypothetical protein EJ05DRAFT_472066 [Pseudovirgaria hyperparasitica]|uniref:Uncharacterized protein n=1 Tax=Pseudovirgaria hyperparasitica TaxID=470096 RepID=A0A6A6WLP5_9PEZI|nr:uncharacterized protein EJ05DRAFT_472066 [Pseudovirgaria hyperparasitica]KAF2763134.1 hypothetical protein EJ05DRAFT_472066 [Pseudovirgaria hyperparasitica]
MQSHCLALVALLLAPFVTADVEFTKPAAGATINGGGAIEVAWKDSGSSPSLSDLTGYVIELCAGSNQEFSVLAPVVENGIFTTGNAAQGVTMATVGASIKNAYFLKITSTGKAGTVINYSSRFSLSNMKGSFPTAIDAAAKSVGSSTDGPPTSNQAGAPVVEPGAEQFDVPFGQQTGNVRFAPMMKVPPTKITKKDKSPLYPTSSYSVAKTFLPIPSIATTITQSQTFSVASRENTAAPAAMPTDDMAKYLARWKD